MIYIYTDEVILNVKQANDIVEIVSRYVQLKRSGSHYVGKCPFHKDDTPSFRVYPKTQSFYCFGCGAGSAKSETNGSDVIAFIAKMENIEIEKAVEKLAELKGVSLEENMKHEELYTANLERSRGFYIELYNHPDIMNYIYGRGLTDEDISEWRIGYSESGYFEDRIIFPIINVSGKTCGFTGRVTGNQKPKYKHSEVSSVFARSNTLYGIEKSVKAIKETRKVYVVEGPFDKITLHKNGVENSVATLGCQISENQIKRLIAMGVDICLVYDGDTEGVNGMLQAAKKFVEFGVSPKICMLPDCMDPDEFCNKYEKPGELIDSMANDYCLFMLKDSIDKYEKQLFELKKGLMKDIHLFLKTVPEGELHDSLISYIQTLAKGGIVS